jgi:hypothetical protein
VTEISLIQPGAGRQGWPVGNVADAQWLGCGYPALDIPIRAFVDGNRHAVADIAQSLEAGDRAGAERRAHTLKGVAATLGATLPAGSVEQAFVLEVVLTAILMLTILSVSTGAREKGITAAIAIGGVVGLEAMFAGPACGASMNPARSLAPAVLSGNFQHLWLYPAATVLGALLAVPLCKLVRGRFG